MRARAESCLRRRALGPGPQSGEVSVFMGVPTMYSYLLAHYDSQVWRNAAAKCGKTVVRQPYGGAGSEQRSAWGRNGLARGLLAAG
jgi:hypothetical protein